MSIIDISVDMIPSALLIEGDLEAIASELGTFEEPLRAAVTNVMLPSILTNFEVGGRPAWPDLAEGTWAQKKTDQILVESGDLRDVMTSIDVWQFDGNTAQISDIPEDVYYGAYIDQGTRFMPARPFLMVQGEDIDQMAEEFDKWMGRSLSAHGFTEGGVSE
jgi:phage gpG-like protein